MLAGALVTGGFAIFLAERQAERASRDRRRERQEQREDLEAKAAEASAFEALSVARHLEAYAKECAEVVAEPWEDRAEDYRWPKPVPQLKAYGAVAWERLGAVATAAAYDLVERHRLRRGFIVGDADGGDSDERARVYGDGAARLGLDAWETAAALRRRASLPAFEFVEDSWHFVETLADRVADADRRAAVPEKDGF